MSTVYNEPGLSQEAKEVHRALASLIEELEAIDWYNQRADVSQDEDLKAILLHNRNEEIEHASMALEWLRRRIPEFDRELRTYIFTTAPVTQVEEAGQGTGNEGGTAEPEGGVSGSLGIGNLTRKEGK
jgi:ferritin-like protein